jgi:hypothetical protein
MFAGLKPIGRLHVDSEADKIKSVLMLKNMARLFALMSMQLKNL